jgi:hypothetical protein
MLPLLQDPRHEYSEVATINLRSMTIHRGGISIGTIATILTILGTLGGFAVWVQDSITAQVAPVQAQTSQLSTQEEETAITVAQTQEDVKWIKSALESSGFKAPPQASFITQSGNTTSSELSP